MRITRRWLEQVHLPKFKNHANTFVRFMSIYICFLAYDIGIHDHKSKDHSLCRREIFRADKRSYIVHNSFRMLSKPLWGKLFYLLSLLHLTNIFRFALLFAHFSFLLFYSEKGFETGRYAILKPEE